jgi:hypothetical protein
MNILTKSLLSAGAAAAALVSIAVPAQARERYDRHRDSVSAGEVIAGAVVIGGLAALLSAGKNNRNNDGDNYEYNRPGYNYDDRGGNSRAAVNRCINTVERWSNGYRRSEVTQVRDIQRTRFGYRVIGNLVVQDSQRDRDYNDGYGADRYKQGYRNNQYDRYDGSTYGRGYNKGRFTCTVERGRVVGVDYSGLDQWR